MIRLTQFLTALLCLPGAALAVPAVVADAPVTASLVAAVMGELGAPQTLVGAGQDAHDLQLRPSQASALRRADLLVWVGPQMTGWLDGTADAMGTDRVLTLLDVPGTRLRDAAGGSDHGHGDGDHAHGHIDPHAWLDPTNGALWLQAIAEALASRDAANAPTYRANAANAVESLAALDARLQAQLAPVRGLRFVVAHDAFGYFTDHYGLRPALAVASGGAATPGAARLTGLRRELAATGAACAFPEANHDAATLTTVVEGSGIAIGPPLDPEGSGLEPGPQLYPAVLEALAATIGGCPQQ
ncbi:zinc ABC transporter substrate-binding protein [Paracoccus luteus]|uniref:zinc ABC transporter substrate-binding protein n=1 Tax=Paracoccus luteus TaxID=2508543 RepID=UPI00106FF95A|nr:zinc ABC transporter substrate-binding protein [Paracoccus luteus]